MSKKINLKWASLFVILLIISCAAFMLTYQKTTIIENPAKEDIKYQTLVCSINNDTETFFKTSKTTNVYQEIKILYKNEFFDSISYTYNGKYLNYETASEAENTLHVIHDEYIGKKNYPITTLQPAYSTIENEAKLTLYAKASKLDFYLATMFAIIDIDQLDSVSISEMEKNYVNQSYSCEYK